MVFSFLLVHSFLSDIILSYLREDVNSVKEAQPVSFAGTGSSVLHTSDPTESRLLACVVSIGTSKLADQFGAGKIDTFRLL